MHVAGHVPLRLLKRSRRPSVSAHGHQADLCLLLLAVWQAGILLLRGAAGTAGEALRTFQFCASQREGGVYAEHRHSRPFDAPVPLEGH